MGEDEGGPLLNGQLQERPLDGVAVRDPCKVVTWRRRLQGELPDLGGAASGAPHLVVAGVDEQPVQPGVEPIPIAKGAEVAPCPQQRVLHGILGQVGLAEDPPRDRVQAVIRRGRERVERLVTALLGLLHQFRRRPSGHLRLD